MKIDTEFNIKDHVYSMHSGDITSLRIDEITIKIDTEDCTIIYECNNGTTYNAKELTKDPNELIDAWVEKQYKIVKESV